MQSAEVDSISRLSVVISDTIAQRNGMAKESDNCSLAYYRADAGSEALWIDLCVTRDGSTGVIFYVSEFHAWSWGPKGDRLRNGVRDTLTAQFGARVSER